MSPAPGEPKEPKRHGEFWFTVRVLLVLAFLFGMTWLCFDWDLRSASPRL